MRILAVDQARNGAWSVFNYEDKTLLRYGVFSYGADVPFDEFMVSVVDVLKGVIYENDVDAVFIEDTQCQVNINSFKKLCWLQGALIFFLKHEDILYEIVPPSRWQGFCRARGRSSKEIKEQVTDLPKSHRMGSKDLSINYVRDNFEVETDNDNLADAICIGNYVVKNITLRKGRR